MKYFLTIREPTDADWSCSNIIELTLPMSWTAGHTLHRNSIYKSISEQDISEWSHRLGRLNKEATLHTLQSTTQLVRNADAENRITPRVHFKCRLLVQNVLRKVLVPTPFIPLLVPLGVLSVHKSFLVLKVVRL
jgi:hypothetical protein